MDRHCASYRALQRNDFYIHPEQKSWTQPHNRGLSFFSSHLLSLSLKCLFSWIKEKECIKMIIAWPGGGAGWWNLCGFPRRASTMRNWTGRECSDQEGDWDRIEKSSEQCRAVTKNKKIKSFSDHLRCRQPQTMMCPLFPDILLI